MAELGLVIFLVIIAVSPRIINLLIEEKEEVKHHNHIFD